MSSKAGQLAVTPVTTVYRPDYDMVGFSASICWRLMCWSRTMRSFQDKFILVKTVAIFRRILEREEGVSWDRLRVEASRAAWARSCSSGHLL